MSDTFPNLYTVDNKGKVRFWRLEKNPLNASEFRTASGIVDGTETCSGWTTCTPKNTGRANATTAEEQCDAEIAALYKKKRDRKYYDDLAEVGTAKYFVPMLAETYDPKKHKITNLSFTQPKLDGIRCIAKRDGLWSRQGQMFYIPHIWDALAPFFARQPNLVFDGELYNHELRDNFNGILSLVKRQKKSPEDAARCVDLVQYHIYDCPSVPGGFFNRWDAVKMLTLAEPLIAVRTNLVACVGDVDENYQEYLAAGYEGQIIRFDAPYENKRSKHLLKRKDFMDDEFPLHAVEEGNGNWSGVAKRIIARLPDGRLFGAGVRGSLDEMCELLKTWRRYEAVTIRFFEYTPDGMPRFPVATKFHTSLKERV